MVVETRSLRVTGRVGGEEGRTVSVGHSCQEPVGEEREKVAAEKRVVAEVKGLFSRRWETF